MWGRGLRPIQERVSSLFYAHGLFCASHPVAIITLVIGIVILTWYPLTRIPLPGNAPQQFTTPIYGYQLPPPDPPTTAPDLEKDSDLKTPRWYFGTPVAYIQQIVIKVTVSPWQPRKLIQTDAFRAPLSKSFEILEQIHRYQLKTGNGTQVLSDICVHVAETMKKFKARGVLPEYNCLILSPANLWGRDKKRFTDDGKIIKTIYKDYGPQLNAPPSIRDVLFGLPMKDTGVKRFYLRNRQRIISYAVTLFLQDYNPRFLSGLRDVLNQRYPLSMLGNHSEVEHLVHVHYKDINYYVEYTPLIISYLFLFLYLYFSVRKIEMVKSKWGLALSAVFTVVASLTMSVGLCTLVGLAPSLSGSEIFPYLVIIVGLENVLVVTKSVVSTPVHLDVKLRVAQGISREGWYIFKNLITELLVLAVGFFTFVPAIQEFCLFAVVGLLSDFFLQMFFFVTVLSVDIRRLELSDLHKHGVQQALQGTDTQAQPSPHSTLQCPFKDHFVSGPGLKVDTQLAQSWGGQSTPPSPLSTGVLGQDGVFYYDPTKPKMPRRVKLMNAWARWRVVQRGIMVCVVIWILLIMYKSGLVEHLTETSLGNLSEEILPPNSMSPALEKLLRDPYDPGSEPLDEDHYLNRDRHGSVDGPSAMEDGAGLVSGLVQHTNMETWRELSHLHWPTVLGFYNISLKGRYLTILPSVGLSAIITPDDAVAIRHPMEEQAASHIRLHSEQLDRSHTVEHSNKMKNNQQHVQGTNQELPAIHKDAGTEPSTGSPATPPRIDFALIMKRLTTYPRTTKELVVTVLLGIASLILMMYCFAALYRCVCSRNYAKWRASWSRQRSRKKSPYYKQIRESVPLVLEGHSQNVECLTTDGPLVVSSCLAGKLMVWDSQCGECIATIDRASVGIPDSPLTRTPAPGRNVSDSDADLYAEFHELPPKASSPPSNGNKGRDGDSRTSYRKSKHKLHLRTRSADFRGINFQDLAPDLSSTIDTNFGLAARKSKTLNSERNAVKDVQEGQSQPGLHTSKSVPVMPAMNEGACEISASPPQIAKSSSAVTFSGNFSPGLTGRQPRFSTGTPPQQGYDFSKFDAYYKEHRQELAEKQEYMRRRLSSRSSYDEDFDNLDHLSIDEEWEGEFHNYSAGDSPWTSQHDIREKDLNLSVPAIWCMTCHDNLVVLGCSTGRIEFWDGLTGALKCIYQGSHIGVVCICFVNKRVIAGRLNGVLDFLELETFTSPAMPPTPKASTLQKRGHVRRLSSQGGNNFHELKSWDDEIHCVLASTTRAHQKPINLLQSAGGRVVTASQDHTLKVFRLEDSLCLYTLHGHSGHVTALHLDKLAPLGAASGSEDGSVRLWDLLTGACVHKLYGHQGAITAVTCTFLYVVSSGLDDRLCIWERCKGHMLHWIQMNSGYCNSLAMLTSNLLVTGGQGCLYLWDISKGEVLRVVKLGDEDHSVFVRQLHIAANSTVVCDYGPQLRLIHFPAVLEKAE